MLSLLAVKVGKIEERKVGSLVSSLKRGKCVGREVFWKEGREECR